MSHADSILNFGRPCVSCGKPRGNLHLLKCLDCTANETGAPITEAEIQRATEDALRRY